MVQQKIRLIKNIITMNKYYINKTFTHAFIHLMHAKFNPINRAISSIRMIARLFASSWAQDYSNIYLRFVNKAKWSKAAFQKVLLLTVAFFVLALSPQEVHSANFTVSNLNDSGDGSLRWAIEQANAAAGPHTINFNVTGIITLVTALPSITRDYTIIDASSQWQGTWPDGAPGITIDGTNLLNTFVGIYLNGASYCEIRGLHITNFSADQCKGILTFDYAQYNIIGGTGAGMRNVITNCYTGIELRSGHNTITGNYIGVAPDGTTAAPNNQRGVYINQSYDNTIGGNTEAERNIISGNTLYGIYIDGQYTNVKGNYIGVDKNGTASLPNGDDGIIVTAQNNTIGGTETGDGNLISGNTEDGVYLLAADNNTILGNYIGTDKNGTSALGNGNAGIYIANGADNNVIGGTTAAARNIISANNHSGVMITGSQQNQVKGNYIGTDVNGTADLGNTYYGAVLFGGAQSNTIGGTNQGSGNVISGNNSSGLAIRQANTNNNLVQGNYIGTTADGILDKGNTEHGVYIAEGAKYNTIGGTVSTARNIIGGNNYSGIAVENNGTDENAICGNYIGLNVLGDLRGNSDYGVYVRDGADGTIIGGDTENHRNIISGNDDGIKVGRTDYAEVTNTHIKNNYIGTDPTGKLDKGNSYYGIFVSVPSSNTQIINNVISGNNGGSGVNLNDGPNILKGNIIGSDKDQETALPNSSEGIRVDCENNTIGGATAGEGNFIAWNGGDGIQIELSNNTVYGNTICLNDDNGIRIAGYGEHADNNMIGGINPGEANTIYSNGINGVEVYGADDTPDSYDFRYTDYNRISGNSIYDNTGLGIYLVESGNGPGTVPHIAAPVLSTTNLNGNTLHIEGTGAGSSASVEIFLADDGTSAEGKTFLGNLTADASKAAGDFSGDLDVSGLNIAAGDNIVATTTHTDNNTSEFSAGSIVSEANTIISAQTGDWNSTNTWIGGQIPASTNDVIIYEGHTISVNGAQSCQKLTLQTDAELTLNAGLPVATSGYVFSENSTVNYANAAKGNQTIEAAPVYGNLKLSGTGNKTANEALNIAGDLDITNSAVFLSNYALSINGNLTTNGTAQFNPAGNTNINGSFTLSENSSCQNNGLLSVDGAILLQDNSELTMGNNLDVNSDVTIGADATLNGGSYILFVGGNWSQYGTWNSGTSTVNFDKSSGNQNIGPSMTGSEIQVGTGSDSENYYPFNNWYKNNKTQMLYLSSDIGESGSIYAIQLNISVVSPDGYRDFNNFTVRLNHTSESNWKNKGSYADMTNAVTVLSQNIYTLPSETGWFTINFDVPFAYDNTNNLIVEIVWGPNSAITYNEYEVLTTDYPYSVDRVLYGRSNDQTPPDFYNEEDKLPNMKFMFEGSGSREFYNLHVNKSAVENELTIVADLLINNNLDVVSGALATSYNVEVTGNASVGSTTKSSSQITIEPEKSITVNGNLTMKNNGTLTIASNATGTGSLIVNGTASGPITAERYIAGHGGTADAGWHLIGSPVNNMAIAGSWIPASGSDDLYAWSEPEYLWLNYHQGDITNFLNGVGYLVAYQSTTIHSFSGTPNTGDVTVTLSWTDRVDDTEEGWNLLGNPYPSALIWGTGWDLANVQATAQVFNSSAKTYDPLSAGDIIPANQGFFVQAKTTANGQNFTIPSAQRTHSSTAFYKAGDANRLKLKVYPESASQFRDIFTVDVNDQAEAGFDAFDAYELYGMGDTPQLFAIDNATNNLSVQSIHPQALEDVTLLNLGVQAAAGNYVIEVESMLPDEDVSVILEDLETGTFTDLRAVNTYVFTVSEGAASERFVLHLGKNATSIETPETLDNEVTIFAGNNRIYVKSHTTLTNAIVSVYNTVGQLVKTTDYYSGEQVLQIRQSGTYIVRVEANEGVSIQKVIVQ
jgi:parallel beta-helix repeat protein